MSNHNKVSELKRISVVTPCFNEEENVKELYEQIKAVFIDLPQYEYEHIFIDNASKDRTVAILKEIAQKDRRVKIIVNTRNFGHIRSPFHALMQAKGDAAICIVADLQDPPVLIKEFIKKWEEGYKIVIGTAFIYLISCMLRPLHNSSIRHSGLDPESRKDLIILDSGFRRNECAWEQARFRR